MRFEVPDMAFFLPSGEELTTGDWDSGFGTSLAVFINGNPLDGGSRSGGDIDDDDLLLLFNAADQEVSFILPDARFAVGWASALSTDEPPSAERIGPAQITGWRLSVTVSGRCVQVLVATNREAP
jgi:pullulanase/glycogen debranching enzyme